MRKIAIVKIELDPIGDADPITKAFTIKELSIQNILDLSQTNAFFDRAGNTEKEIKKQANGDDSIDMVDKAEKGILDHLSELSTEVDKVMAMTCDFTITDLKKLSPSEIRTLFDKFREVNQDFLDLLERLKILEAFQGIIQRAFSAFSGTFAI